MPIFWGAKKENHYLWVNGSLNLILFVTGRPHFHSLSIPHSPKFFLSRLIFLSSLFVHNCSRRKTNTKLGCYIAEWLLLILYGKWIVWSCDGPCILSDGATMMWCGAILNVMSKWNESGVVMSHGESCGMMSGHMISRGTI